jgi:predicted amidohydrolase
MNKPAGETLRLGLWQHAGSPDGVAANLAIIEAAAEKARAERVDLLVFPECFLTGYYRQTGIEEVAAAVDPQMIRRLEDLARRTGIALVIGAYEMQRDKFYNTALCVTPDRGCIARHRKRALYGPWEERHFTPGSEPVLFDYRGFRIGILICFDVEFPELARELAQRRADLILVPTALMAPNENVAETLVPARAIENQLFVAYANRIGREGPFDYVGRSCICAPDGRALCRAGADQSGLILADLGKDAIGAARSEFSYITSVPPV